MISRLRFQISDVNDAVLQLLDFLIFILPLLELYSLVWWQLRFFVATWLASLSIMLFDVVVKFEQVLLDLQLLADLDGQLHTLLHLMLSFFLFHEPVHLQRMPFLLSLNLLLVQWFLRFLVRQYLCRAR